ncbi:hypothetical protein LP421_11250 [Rhizobium sp. RCAM05350]|nr:hypothetical protein LP421_11250 [Rhizobium sp. RCAM05350]
MFSISAVLQPERVVTQIANVKATLFRNFMSDLKYRFVNDISLKVTLADAPLHFVPASGKPASAIMQQQDARASAF